MEAWHAGRGPAPPANHGSRAHFIRSRLSRHPHLSLIIGLAVGLHLSTSLACTATLSDRWIRIKKIKERVGLHLYIYFKSESSLEKHEALLFLSLDYLFAASSQHLISVLL